MGENLARKLIADHLAEGDMEPGSEIALRVDQVLTHDGTGPLGALELEAMGSTGPCAQTAVAYVDHLLVESDSKNADDYVLLESAAQRFGWWFSRAGNGVSHPVHQQRFGVSGAFLLGTDSHTPAAGALGMLAIGAGELALAGEPFWVTMPEIWGVRLVGELPDWVSAKDVILEMLRRHGMDGATGRIIEYHGPGLAALSAMDRHVIANMGTELGATTTVFPSDAEIRRYLTAQHRSTDWRPLVADPDADYEYTDVTTDEILPAGARVLSLWSNLPGMSEHVFGPLDESYVDRARRAADTGGHAVIGGCNYGQGSSREHLDQGTTLCLRGLHQALRSHAAELDVEHDAGTFRARYTLSPRQIDVLLAGGTIAWIRHRSH